MTDAVDATAMNFVLSGNVSPGDYAGGGLAFDTCVNTTAYTGVQFTLGGTVAGCDLYFQAQTFDEKPTKQGGGCTASSCSAYPRVKLSTTTGVVTVHFTDLSGGLPAPASIASEVVGVQWQFQSPAPVGDAGQPGCTGIKLTVDDVSFVSN
jgi:hypothetical protein